MRKMYQIAIAAAAVCMVASCGNKTGNAGDSADSTATEQPAEVKNYVGETDDFSVTGPEGWEVKGDSFSGSVRMEDVNSKETFKPVIQISIRKDKTVKEMMDYYVSGDTKKGADFVAGDYTFTTARNSSSKLYYGMAQLPDGRLLEFMTAYFEPESGVLKPVIESIKLKN